eukprot:5449899-Amphidinium_carterae.1
MQQVRQAWLGLPEHSEELTARITHGPRTKRKTVNTSTALSTLRLFRVRVGRQNRPVLASALQDQARCTTDPKRPPVYAGAGFRVMGLEYCGGLMVPVITVTG